MIMNITRMILPIPAAGSHDSGMGMIIRGESHSPFAPPEFFYFFLGDQNGDSNNKYQY
jgi:hypothetical protein